MARPALRFEVPKKDQKELKKLLSGGVQQVRVVLRAMALLQVAKGVSAPRIAEVVPLTALSPLVRMPQRKYGPRQAIEHWRGSWSTPLVL